jgi:hypothetical protein
MTMLPTRSVSIPRAAGVDDITIQALADSYGQIVRRFLPALIFLAGLFGSLLLLDYSDRLPLYVVVVLPALLILARSARLRQQTLPVMPLYVVIQALSFASPLFAPELVLRGINSVVPVSPALLASAVFPLALWLPSLWIGWSLTSPGLGVRRQAPALTQSLFNPRYLPHISLAIAIILQLLINSPQFWLVLGGFQSGLISPIRTLAGLASMVGAFTGAYAWGSHRLPNSLLWFVLLAVPLVISLSSLLLSSLQATLIALLLGLWLGRSRLALAITLITLLLLSFLNVGKSIIRSNYWSAGVAVPDNPIVLLQEWSQASLDAMAAGDSQLTDLSVERFNNLQNLFFVQNKLDSGTPTLNGESLWVIPQTLVPRIINPDKIRSQEGQVLLNLHFGRQSDRETTETTYIAWGFLAEGIGNFGSLFGPLLMGLFTGGLLRITENIGRGQMLVSTPGLINMTLMLLWLTSYEMSASTFFAAMVQLIVVVLFVGWWFSPRNVA